MALPFYNWSKTAASNATADSTVNWAEGQAPSSVNDSARAMMASTAAFRDDISGAIATGGTSTAYTVTSYQVFDTLAHMANQMVAFTPHTTNGATVTLNVDSLGAKPLRSAPSTELLAGTLIQGTPYVAVYNNSDAVFYLQGFFGNPYNVPLGSSLEFWGATSPNSSFALMYGQAISRTTYSTLFTMFSTTYGVGDGSTTFNIPDVRGRVTAGKDDMGGSAASRLTSTYFGTSAATLGAVGGLESHTLTKGESAVLTYATSFSVLPSQYGPTTILSNVASTSGISVWASNSSTTTTQLIASGGTLGTTADAGGNPHKNIQPTIICNRILRLI
jgi:microcystin-dependent protein